MHCNYKANVVIKDTQSRLNKSLTTFVSVKKNLNDVRKWVQIITSKIKKVYQTAFISVVLQ